MASINLRVNKLWQNFHFGWTISLTGSEVQNGVTKHTAENDCVKVKEHWTGRTYLWLQTRMRFMCCRKSGKQNRRNKRRRRKGVEKTWKNITEKYKAPGVIAKSATITTYRKPISKYSFLLYTWLRSAGILSSKVWQKENVLNYS